MTRKPKRKPLKLTREQRKAIWKPVESNLGLGWKGKYEDETVHDPIILERGRDKP